VPKYVEVAESAAPKPALFASYDDEKLLAYGVPPEWLADVKGADEDTLLDLADHLPAEAAEALLELATGGEPPTPEVAEKITDPFAHPDAQRRFRVMTDGEELARALEFPWDKWTVFLHPSQRKMVERDYNGPARVSGSAGTGKTVVAMHRAVWLARKYRDLPGSPVVFTTFTRTLADDIRRNLALLASPREMEKIRVLNLDQWASNLLRQFGYPHALLFDGKIRRDTWRAAIAARPVAYPTEFLRAEFERVVLPQGCETVDDYMRARRVGRGGQLGRAQRKAIWPVFAEYRARLLADNWREPEEAYREACELLRNEKPDLGVRAVVVDEAQDISAAAFELIRAAVPEGDNDLFIVGDAHQRIYRHKVVLSKAGIQVRGRSRALKINYRTTDEIRRWACAQLEGSDFDDLEGERDLESLRGYRSLTHGDAPEILASATPEEDAARIAELLRQLESDGVESRQICVTARTRDDIGNIAEALKARGVACFQLAADTPDDDATPGVRLATMHRIKGLEFDVVVIAAYRGAHDYAEKFARDEDVGAASDIETAERCLLHVAATRAKRHLFVLRRQG